MPNRAMLNQSYYLSIFNPNSAWTEYGYYTAPNETEENRVKTIFSVGDYFDGWIEVENGMQAVKKRNIMIPKDDITIAGVDYVGIPTPEVDALITFINPDTEEDEETFRLDEFLNQNRKISNFSCVLEVYVKRGGAGQ